MDEKVDRHAATLTAVTWRKTFRQDAKLRADVFREIVSALPDELDEKLTDYEGGLHPSQSINVSDDRQSISIDDDQGAIVRCFINSAGSGVLRLQFFKRGFSSESGTVVQLVLERHGERFYIWTVKTDSVPNDTLAEYILERLFVEAIEVVKRETPPAQI